MNSEFRIHNSELGIPNSEFIIEVSLTLPLALLYHGLGAELSVSENKKAEAEVETDVSPCQPPASEQRWKEQTLKPALSKSPERRPSLYHALRRSHQSALHAC